MKSDKIEKLNQLPEGYDEWRSRIENLIESSKLSAALHVNTDMLQLYWNIGYDILTKQKNLGWGTQVIERLSSDLTKRFPGDKGYSVRNLHYMRRFAETYPQFPILQVPLAEFKKLPISQVALAELAQDGEIVSVPLTIVSWYHHIKLIPTIKNEAERAFYILEASKEGWSTDVTLMKHKQNYLESVGKAITNFKSALPSPESDLAQYVFKDPYIFSFLGTLKLKTEHEIELRLAERITEFLLEMGRGFSFIGRQYNIVVDGEDYYIDILMYHVKLHCYVVIELKAVEFKPEFVSKLNFYISAVDEYVKTPLDNPTIGLLLCRDKSNKKVEFALRGVSQPMGVAQYEMEKLFNEVASALPKVDEDLDYLYHATEID